MNEHYIIPLFVAGTLLLILFAFFLIAILLVQKSKQNRYQQEKERTTFKYQNEILRVRLEVQENAMDQISKEIHDNVGQLLGLAQMNMYRIEDIVTAEKDKKMIASTNSFIGQAITDLKNISHSLNSDYIKRLGLIDVLSKDLEYIKHAKNMDCTLQVEGDPVTLPPEKEVLIYRIAQEAIQNTLKYAKATKIVVYVDYSNGKLLLCISDNGVGFDTGKIDSSQGIGLSNMYQRASFLDGKLDIQSSHEAGSKITLVVDTLRNEAQNTDTHSYS